MPTPTYTPLANVTLASATSSLSFSSIPATYRDLILIGNVQAQSDSFLQYRLRVNGDTGANYNNVRMENSGGSTLSSADSNATEMTFFSTSTSGVFSAMITNFMDYSATNKHKTLIARSSGPQNTVGAQASRWANTAVITSITILTPSGQFTVGSSWSLYGVIA
jgi:hypothetical protein